MSDDRTAVAEEEDVAEETEEQEAETSQETEQETEEEATEEETEEEVEAEAETETEEETHGTRPKKGASETIRELRARAQRAERERDEIRQRAEAPRQVEQPRETPQQRQERLSLMDPEQRTQYLLDEQRFFNDQRFSALERTTYAVADKSSFDSVCARKPHFDAVREDVEAEFQRLLQQGRFVPRETLAKYVIGDRIDKRGGKALAQQRRRGRERVAGQRTRAPGGGSDVTAERRQRGDTAAAREARLSKEEI